MPVSRNRKNQKQKARQRRSEIEASKRKYNKLVEQRMKMFAEQMSKQGEVAGGVTNPDAVTEEGVALDIKTTSEE